MGSDEIEDEEVVEDEGEVEEELRRKSCVIAIPIEAKAREVRSQARNVRSVGEGNMSVRLRRGVERG